MTHLNKFGELVDPGDGADSGEQAGKHGGAPSVLRLAPKVSMDELRRRHFPSDEVALQMIDKWGRWRRWYRWPITKHVVIEKQLIAEHMCFVCILLCETRILEWQTKPCYPSAKCADRPFRETDMWGVAFRPPQTFVKEVKTWIADKPDGIAECKRCGGDGQMPCTKCHATGSVKRPCKNCSGDGVADGRSCPRCNGSGEVSAVCPTCNGSRNMSCDVCEGRGALGRHAVVKASFQPRRLNVTLGLRQDVGDDKWQEKDLPDLPATDDLFPGGPSDVSGCAHFLSLQRATVEGPGVLEDGSINDLPERLMKTLRDGFGDLIAKAEGRIRRTGVAVLWHPYVCVVYRRRPEDAPKHLFVNYDGMVISHGALPANRRFWICNVLSAVAVLLGFALWSECEPAPGFIAWGLGLVILVVGWCVPPRARKKSAQDFHDQEPNTQEQPVVSTPTLTGERDE
jgi:hypothetical protein